MNTSRRRWQLSPENNLRNKPKNIVKTSQGKCAARYKIAGLEPRKRGKKPVPRNPLAGEVEQLRRETQRLQKRLRQAETIIDVQKKLCDLLGLTVPRIEQDGSDE